MSSTKKFVPTAYRKALALKSLIFCSYCKQVVPDTQAATEICCYPCKAEYTREYRKRAYVKEKRVEEGRHYSERRRKKNKEAARLEIQNYVKLIEKEGPNENYGAKALEQNK